MRIRPQGKARRIPILMYHSISDSRHEGVHPYYETATSPNVFAEQMKFLHEKKYRVINLEDIIKYYGNGKNMEEKAVVITFDDGFHDFYTEAFPILQYYGFSATDFLPTGFIDNKRLKFNGKECLFWEEVRELRGKGVIFGSHTVNHLKLNTLEKIDIEFELKRSKEQIEEEIGEPIEGFSYPFAFPEEDKEFTKGLRRLLRKCGYKYGVSTRIGTITRKDDFYSLKRTPVNTFDDLPLFSAKLEGAYDWLAYPQLLIKKLKANICYHRSANIPIPTV